MTTDRIYLDNAATSWPKPEAVYAAVDRYQRANGAPAGRSAYREAMDAERIVSEARRAVGELLGVSDSSRVIFTLNGTDSLNLALHGLLRAGDHVITSVCEHNSVLRPMKDQEESLGIEVTRLGCDGDGRVSPDEVQQAIKSNTRAIVLIHASNVTGAIQPVEAIGQIAKDQGVLFVVDAAQSLGHMPLHATDLRADLIAAPGHKGLLGPLGTGVLYIAPGVEQQLRSTRQGGTGTQSETDLQPESLPDKYESGNHNVPGIAGLAAGVSYLRDRGLDSIERDEHALNERLRRELAEIRGVTLYGSRDGSDCVGVASITIEGYDPQEAASLFDSAYSIQVRSGLHCAPLMHRALGTAGRGGTLRFSVGPFTSTDEIDRTIAAVAEIAAV